MSVAGNGAPVLGAAEDVPRQSQAGQAMMDGLSSSKVTGRILVVPLGMLTVLI